jgi:DNA-binding NarL/FixJ family response regulator
MIRVIVADDHAVVRHGVRQLLETAPCSDAAGRWANGARAAATRRRPASTGPMCTRITNRGIRP